MYTQICVCGAGTMGSGIAQVCAQHGFPVKLFDIRSESLDRAKVLIDKNLDYLVKKGRISAEEKFQIFSRIQFIDKIEQCTGFVIIEAIIEKKEAKVELFNQLAEYNNEEVIFASNTSSISLTEMQQEISYPQRVIGMHFFNPAYIMPLVEIIKGDETNDQVIAALLEICDQLGKKTIICKDSPGFVVNRVARPYYLESLKLLEKNVASFEGIDTILEATGFKMGPFRLMDMIGMDINLATSESVYEAMGRPVRLEPSPIQQKKVKAGELGKKTGRGFYNYDQLIK